MLRQDEPLVLQADNGDDVKGEAALREACKHLTPRTIPVSKSGRKLSASRTTTRRALKASVVTVKTATVKGKPAPSRNGRAHQSTKGVPGDDDMLLFLEKLARRLGIEIDNPQAKASKPAFRTTNPQLARVITPTEQEPLIRRPFTSDETTIKMEEATSASDFLSTITSMSSVVTSSSKKKSMIGAPVIRIIKSLVTSGLSPGPGQAADAVQILAGSSLVSTSQKTSASTARAIPDNSSSGSLTDRTEHGGSNRSTHLTPLDPRISKPKKIVAGRRSPEVSLSESYNSSAGISFAENDSYTAAHTEPFLDEATNYAL